MGKLLNLYVNFLDYVKFLLLSNRKLFDKNKNLKNVGSGKRAFLLATGPSIKSEDLKQLAGEDCFSLSNFFLHEDINLINPIFHFFAPYHKPLILKNYVKWLRQSDKILPKTTKIFLGHTTYDLVTKYKLFPHREVYYLYLSNCFNADITKRVLGPQTGPIMMLPVLIYMGYKEIYLLGCDHNCLKDFRKPIQHFYNKALDIRKNASDENAWGNIINELDCAKSVFVQYQKYKSSLGDKTKIINLSHDSWLDVFDMANLKDII